MGADFGSMHASSGGRIPNGCPDSPGTINIPFNDPSLAPPCGGDNPCSRFRLGSLIDDLCADASVGLPCDSHDDSSRNDAGARQKAPQSCEYSRSAAPSDAPPRGGVNQVGSKMPMHAGPDKSIGSSGSRPNKKKAIGATYSSLASQSLSYPKWCESLVCNVLKSKTPFAAFLSSTIQLSRMPRKPGKPVPTFFPVPLPFIGAFNRMSRNSSADTKHTRHLSRAVHVIVAALNYWHAGGKHGDIELLRREPARHHLVLYQRIRFLIESEGPAEIANMPKAGRRFPKLAARLSELSESLTRLGASCDIYDRTFAGCDAPVDSSKAEELRPYHDLDPEKIVLFARGPWDPTPFLDDELGMAYREPKVLLHHLESEPGPLIRDEAETLARLAKKWDQLDLLFLRKQRVLPEALVRIFGAMKDPATHRQIGDRRGQNSRECKVPAGTCHLDQFLLSYTYAHKLIAYAYRSPTAKTSITS